MASWNEQRRDSFAAAYKLFKEYWHAYGGWKALTSSPYFIASVVLVVLLYPLWSEPDWWEVSLGFLPTAMGFTLAAFAMILAFGNKGFIAILAKKAEKRDSSALKRISNAFFHFLVIQFLALIAAIFCRAYYVEVPGWMGSFLRMAGINEAIFVSCTQKIFWPIAFGLTVYSMVCGLTASVRVYRLAGIFLKVMNHTLDKCEKNESE